MMKYNIAFLICQENFEKILEFAVALIQCSVYGDGTNG